MSDDVEDGGPEDLDEIEFPTPEQKAFRKKMFAVMVAITIIISSVGIWYFFFRHWSIREIGERLIETEGADSFDSMLAGTSVFVEGKVTYIQYTNTTFGPLTLIELDDYGWLCPVEWGVPSVSLGDTFVKEIHFEWSQYNDDVLVLSPQLHLPTLVDALQHELATAFSSIRLLGRDDDSSPSTIIEVFLPRKQGFPLGMFNATIKEGIHSGFKEWREGFANNPMIDHMDSLVEGRGENDRLAFVDAGSDGLLNDGDYFQINLTRPEADSAVLSYYLQVNDYINHSFPTEVLGGTSYIPMTNRGLLRWLLTEDSLNLTYPGGRMEVVSEVEHIGGISSDIIISDFWGPPQSLTSTTCHIQDENRDIHTDCDDGIVEGVIISTGNFSITYHDANVDGFLNAGDTFAFSGLENWTGYSFSVNEIAGVSRFISLSWRVGIGTSTGYLPVIDWGNPEPLGLPANLTYRLEIERMYGIPGVPLQDSEERYTVDLKAAGTLLLSSVNVTSNMSIDAAPLTISFHDADDNGYVNSGDFFIVRSSIAVAIELTMNYTVRDLDGTGDVSLISWPVSWQAG